MACYCSGACFKTGYCAAAGFTRPLPQDDEIQKIRCELNLMVGQIERMSTALFELTQHLKKGDK